MTAFGRGGPFRTTSWFERAPWRGTGSSVGIQERIARFATLFVRVQSFATSAPHVRSYALLIAMWDGPGERAPLAPALDIWKMEGIAVRLRRA